MEVEKYGEELVEDPEKLLPFLLVTINDLFSKLEALIGHLHATRQVTLKSIELFLLWLLLYVNFLFWIVSTSIVI